MPSPATLLAPGAASRLPALESVRRRWVVRRQPVHVLPAALSLARSGMVHPRDWDADDPTPAGLIENALTRIVGHYTARIGNEVQLSFTLRPYDALYEEVLHRQPEPGEARWIFILESHEALRIPIASLVESIGADAAGLALLTLVNETPLHVDNDSDLEYIIESWGDDEDPDSQEKHRIATKEARQIEDILALGRSAGPAVLRQMPHRLRRAVCAMRAQRATPWERRVTAWEELDEADWAMPYPVVQLIWTYETGLDHAADQSEFYHQQGGDGLLRPQQMWLLDPSDPHDAAEAWAHTRALFRSLRASTRLLRAILALVDPPTAPRTA